MSLKLDTTNTKGTIVHGEILGPKRLSATLAI